MRVSRSASALACAAVLVSGCIPEIDEPHPVVMDVLMAFLGGAKVKDTQELTADTTVTIGGLDGTYDVTLGPYGQFVGTAKVLGKRGAKLVDQGSPGLLGAVHGILMDAFATDVTVSEARAKVAGRQTTGGVHKRYRGRIKFKGMVAAGANAGTPVKGKITARGDLEAPPAV